MLRFGRRVRVEDVVFWWCFLVFTEVSWVSPRANRTNGSWTPIATHDLKPVFIERTRISPSTSYHPPFSIHHHQTRAMWKTSPSNKCACVMSKQDRHEVPKGAPCAIWRSEDLMHSVLHSIVPSFFPSLSLSLLS